MERGRFAGRSYRNSRAGKGGKNAPGTRHVKLGAVVSVTAGVFFSCAIALACFGTASGVRADASQESAMGDTVSASASAGVSDPSAGSESQGTSGDVDQGEADDDAGSSTAIESTSAVTSSQATASESTEPDVGESTETESSVTPRTFVLTTQGDGTDQTTQTDQLMLSVDALIYTDINGTVHTVVGTSGGTYDFSSVPLNSIDYLDMLVDFHIRKDGSERTIKAGDYYEFTLDDMTGTINSQTGVKLADYTVASNTVTVTFTSAVNADEGNTDIFGGSTLKFKLNANGLDNVGADGIPLQLQGDAGGTTYLKTPPATTTVDGITKTGTYDAQTREVTWTVQVGSSPAGAALAGLMVNDTFDSSTQTLKAVYLGDTTGKDITADVVTVDGVGGFTYTFPADSKAVTGQVITVVTGVTDQAILASASGDQALTNHAAMTKGETGPNVGENSTSSSSVTVPAPTATKNGTQVDANTIHYDITIDKDGGFAVWNAVLADQLGADADGDTATYKAGTLTVNGTAIAVYDSEQQGMTTTYATYIGDKLEVHFADAPLCTATQVSFDATITAADSKTATNFNFDNTASITGDFPNYEGTGPDTNLHVNIMPEATTDFQVTSVSKEVTNVDKATGKITWKITPSVRTSSFDNWYIEDVIGGSWGGSGYTLGTLADGSAADQTYVANSVKVYDGATDITEQCCDVATESKSIGGIDTTVLTVKLKDDWVNALKGDINNITVEVTTKAQNYLIENYVSHTYNNATHLNVTKGLTSFDSHANASTAFSDDYLKKTCTYEVLDNADGTAQGYLHYTIDVNKSGLSCTGLTVTDDLNNLTATLTPKGGGTGTTIPASAWAVDNSKTVVTDITNGTKLVEGGALGWRFDGTNNKVFTANFTDGGHPSTVHTYKIDVYLKLTDDARQTYFATAANDGATITSSNTASATSTEFNKGAATTTTGEGSGTTGTVNNALVGKDGVLDSANGSIAYTLNINPNAAALTSATITDSLPSSVAIDQGSVKLYYAKHTTDGAISDELGSEVTSGWSVSYAPNTTTGGTDMTVKLPNGASSYVLAYTAHVVSNVSSVQNSASLTNNGTQIGSGGATTAVDSSAWGWMDQTATLKLVKTDALSGASKTLSGVTFELYDAETGGNLVQTVTTDSNGVASFYGLDVNKDYWYKEVATTTPVGYKVQTGRTSVTTGDTGKAGIKTLTVANDRMTAGTTAIVRKYYSGITTQDLLDQYMNNNGGKPETTFKLYLYPNGYSNGKRVEVHVTLDTTTGYYSYSSNSTDSTTMVDTAYTVSEPFEDGNYKQDVMISGLPWGDYGIEEVSTADGYSVSSGARYFSVGYDAQNLSWAINDTPTSTSSDLGSGITNVPTPLYAQKAADADVLKGVVLSVYTVDEAGKKTETKAVNPFTGSAFTNTISVNCSQADLKFFGLPAGTYVLSEDSPPDNTAYGKFKDVKFTMDIYGHVTLSQPTSATMYSFQTIRVKDPAGSVTVKKLDQYGNGVTGATQATVKLQVRSGTEGNYTWTDVAGDNATWTVGSAEEATTGHTFTGLDRSKTYRVVETAVPTGYRTANHTDTQSIEFEINEYGKATDVNLNNGEATNGTSGNNYLNVGTDGTSTLTLRDELMVGHGQFTKYDSTLLFDEYGSPTDEKKTLSGVSFDLYREASSGQVDLANDKVVSSAPIVSDASGVVSTLTAKDASGNAVTNELTGKPLSEGLGEGTYYFKEVGTRSDFILTSSTSESFTVTQDSTDYTWSTFNVAKLNTTDDYRMKNTPLNAAITLTKVDAGSSTTKVNGATYELRDATTHAVIDTQTTSANGTRFTGTDSNGNTHSRTNTSDGQLWFVDIPAGTYKVVETVSAPGYKLDTTAYDVTVPRAETTYNNYTVKAAGSDYVSDAQNSLTVTKTGVEGATAADLAGATFELTPVDSAKFANSTKTSITWTTTDSDASKTLTGELVAGGVYKLSETAAPAGYRTSADVYLKMDASGNLSQCTTPDGTFTTVAGNALTVTDVQGSFTVAKAGVEGTSADELAGTSFSLVPVGEGATFADGSTNAITWTLNATDPTNNPYAVTGKLVAGSTYKLSETAAPEGYKTAVDVYLKMDAAGNLSQCATASGTFTAVTGNALTITDEFNVFTVAKAGVPGATMRELALTGFELTGVDGAQLASGEDSFIWNTTNESSSYDVRGMLVADGKSVYKLQEFKAPDGYQTSADIYLKMDAAGNLSQCATSDGTFTAVTGNVLTVTDAQTVFKLSKTNDDADPATIAGSTFTLTGVFAGSSDEQTKTLSPTDEGAAGAATLTGQLIASRDDADATHTYTLTETMAPAGYAISMAPKTLRISAAGTLQERGGTEGAYTWTDISGNYLTVADSRTSFSVAKAGVSGATDGQLAGTTFELKLVGTAKFGDGSTDTFSWTTLGSGTTNNPYTMTGRLVADGASVYKLSETAAPAGYQTSADVYLKMTTTGVLQKSTDGRTGWTDVIGNALTVTDAQNSFSVAKVDTTEAGGKYLAGAEFTLYGTFADGSSKIAWTSTDAAPADGSGLITGKLVVSTSDTDDSHVYVLTETKAPDGYTITTPTTWLRVTQSGQLQVRSGEEGSYTWTNVTGNAFKAANDQNSLTLKKTCDRYSDDEWKKMFRSLVPSSPSRAHSLTGQPRKRGHCSTARRLMPRPRRL